MEDTNAYIKVSQKPHETSKITCHFKLYHVIGKLFFYSGIRLFGLVLYVPVNSYGHVRTVSSPNHTFFPGQA